MTTARPSGFLFMAIRPPQTGDAKTATRMARIRAAILAEIARQDAAAAQKKGD